MDGMLLGEPPKRDHVSKQIVHSGKILGLLNAIQRSLFLYVRGNTDGRANNVGTDNTPHFTSNDLFTLECHITWVRNTDQIRLVTMSRYYVGL